MSLEMSLGDNGLLEFRAWDGRPGPCFWLGRIFGGGKDQGGSQGNDIKKDIKKHQIEQIEEVYTPNLEPRSPFAPTPQDRSGGYEPPTDFDPYAGV